MALTNQPDGGEAILEAFRNLGVDYVISSPGSEWPPVWEALARQKIGGGDGPAYLDCGHETLAVGVAAGYTQVTGRMQAVLLHAGLRPAAGLDGHPGRALLRGADDGHVGRVAELWRAADFDPGNQWYRNLGVVGGPQRLIEPLVKWASQAPSPETLYQMRGAAGRNGQARAARARSYLNVPCETMIHGWTPPAQLRKMPEPPKVQPLPADIDRSRR